MCCAPVKTKHRAVYLLTASVLLAAFAAWLAAAVASAGPPLHLNHTLPEAPGNTAQHGTAQHTVSCLY